MRRFHPVRMGYEKTAFCIFMFTLSTWFSRPLPTSVNYSYSRNQFQMNLTIPLQKWLWLCWLVFHDATDFGKLKGYCSLFLLMNVVIFTLFQLSHVIWRILCLSVSFDFHTFLIAWHCLLPFNQVFQCRKRIELRATSAICRMWQAKCLPSSEIKQN